MKKSLLFFMMTCVSALSGYAQDDDVYFVPSKNATQQTYTASDHYASDYTVLESGADNDTWYANRRSTVDVDAYNRRGSYSYAVDTTSNDEIYNQDYATDGGTYTTRIVRFHAPGCIVVASPWYWDIYDNYWFDPWYSWSWGWGWRYSWYDPWYSWGWHGWYGGWGWNWGWHHPWYGGWHGGDWAHHGGPGWGRDWNRGGFGGRRDNNFGRGDFAGNGTRGNFGTGRTNYRGFDGGNRGGNYAVGNRGGRTFGSSSSGTRSFNNSTRTNYNGVRNYGTAGRNFGNGSGINTRQQNGQRSYSTPQSRTTTQGRQANTPSRTYSTPQRTQSQPSRSFNSGSSRGFSGGGFSSGGGRSGGFSGGGSRGGGGGHGFGGGRR